MYPNFAEILKPWPIAKAMAIPTNGKTSLGVSSRQFPGDTDNKTLAACCVENPQSIIFGIRDALSNESWAVPTAYLVVSWDQDPDYALSYDGLIRIAQDLGQFLQGQLLGHRSGHLRISSARVYGFPSDDKVDAADLTIGHSNFELGYNSIAHDDMRQWQRPYMLRTREKTAPKSAEIVRPPVREPLDY